jgi:hypothetical protein
VLENPLAYYHIARRAEDQVPRVVRQHGLVLLHSVAPVGIAECATNRGRDRRQRQGSGSNGGKLRAIHGLGDPSSTTDDMFFTGYCSEGFDEFCYFRDRDAHETSSPRVFGSMTQPSTLWDLRGVLLLLLSLPLWDHYPFLKYLSMVS